MAAASPKKSRSDIQQNTDPVSHELSKWPISPYEFTVGTFFFHEMETIYLLIRSTEQIDVLM